MRYEVELPSLGDDDDAVTGGAVSQWLAEEGALLEQEDDLLELTTDKAAFVVPCPVQGTLIERCVMEGSHVQVGDVLCVLEV
jgi:2-oxoglutarate dehydrogenase E2 component (dihydrolipoamide succinyltransferase)